MAYLIPRSTPSVLALAIALGLAGQAHAEAPRAAELDAVVVTANGNQALRNIAGAGNVITLERAGTRLQAARLREQRWREQPFLLEWLRVGTLVLGMMMADRLLQAAFFVPDAMSPRPPLGQALLHVIATVAAYPLVVLAARVVAGLRRARPGEIHDARI